MLIRIFVNIGEKQKGRLEIGVVGKKIISIKPKNKKQNIHELLSDEQIIYIQKVLETSCQGEVCISRARLFDELKKPLKLTIEQYQFEQALTQAIKNKRIVGFETRSGRNGGVCRLGAFAKHDAAQKQKRIKKPRKSRHCLVTVNDNTYNVPISESQACGFIMTVLNGLPANDGKANVYINNGAYRIPNTIKTIDVLKDYLLNICKGEEKTSANRKEASGGS